AERTAIPESGNWKGKPYFRKLLKTGEVYTWRLELRDGKPVTQQLTNDGSHILASSLCQTVTVKADGTKLVNGLPLGRGEYQRDLTSVGYIDRLPARSHASSGRKSDLLWLSALVGDPNHQSTTGPLDPINYI